MRGLYAHIICARQTVRTIRRVVVDHLAVHACFYSIAIDTVIAVVCIIRGVYARSGVACIVRTRVVIVAVRVDRTLVAGIRRFVAKLLRAARIGTVHAAQDGVAHFEAVAEQPVIARRVVLGMIARIRALIARVYRTGNAVAAIRVRTILTPERYVADFHPITEKSIRTHRMVRRVIARIRRFVARINCTRDRVGAVRIGSVLASQGHVTDLGTVAEQTVAAHGVIRRVIATIRGLVARIHRTGY